MFPGEIPDAAFIHAARKKRQLARELGDFTPHDSEPGKGRLVREDENDASDDEDDDEKRRIVFSVKEKSQRQKIAEEIGNLMDLTASALHCSKLILHCSSFAYTAVLPQLLLLQYFWVRVLRTSCASICTAL